MKKEPEREVMIKNMVMKYTMVEYTVKDNLEKWMVNSNKMIR